MKAKTPEADAIATAELDRIVEEAARKQRMKVTPGGVEGTYFVADTASEVMVFVITRKDGRSTNRWKIETDIQSITSSGKKSEQYQRAKQFTDDLHTTLAGRRIVR